MKNKLLLALLFFTFSFSLKSQQIFRLSQYMQHNYLFNPAASGTNNNSSIGITYKTMWSGIEGGPENILLYGDRYFSKNKVGISSFVYNDVTGPTSRSGLEINFSYAIPFSENKKLQFGLGLMGIQERIDKIALQKYIPNDPLIAGVQTKNTGDASGGIYYSSKDINLGISVKQLIQSKLNFITNNNNPSGRLYRQYYLMGSYNWQTDEENVIVPNFLLKLTENAPTDFEIGSKIIHKNILWTGFNYHRGQDFSAFAGVTLNKKYSIGYAYDLYKTPLSLFDSGGDSHEISLVYLY